MEFIQLASLFEFHGPDIVLLQVLLNLFEIWFENIANPKAADQHRFQGLLREQVS